jgi:hypothetical protein
MTRLSLLLLALPGCASQAVETRAVEHAPAAKAIAGPEAAAGVITPTGIHDRIAFLASDAMRGRNTPSPELERAADYIAESFRTLGLKPAGENGTYYQRYPLARMNRPNDKAPNVAAVLPGSDPALKDTYVIFSAHFDHVGVGRAVNGDSIYNGADDNASGSSALLEVARAFASLPTPPKRSLLFLAVSGEEKGLLGSEYYSDHPTVPLEKIVANINVDMIGRNAQDSIVVIGQEYSSLGPLVQEVAKARPELGLTVAQDIWPEERFFFRSDHYNFARKEIPALFFFAGVHEDYHRPSDQVEKIDTDKASRVARLIFYTAYEIANRPDAPAWTEQGLAEVRALTSRGRR